MLWAGTLSACDSRTSPPATTPATQPQAEQKSPRVLQPFDDIKVILGPSSRDAQVEIKGWVCLDEGWLEQIACGPKSREHESLIVIKAKPSNIHAALLMAGFEPGAPGRWKFENEAFTFVPPTGSELDVFVRYQGDAEQPLEQSVRAWIRDARQNHPFPNAPWVFGGSRFEPNQEWMGPGEHYVADMTGSIIGLVTFGDEVIGFSQVMAHEESVQPLEWEANSEAMPPIGTDVTVIVRPWVNSAAERG